MVAMGRSVTSGALASPGRTVWALVCQAAVRSIDWAAGAWGVKDAQGEAERVELLVGYGVTPEAPWGQRSVDWAKLDELDRARVSREAPGHGPSRRHSLWN